MKAALLVLAMVIGRSDAAEPEVEQECALIEINHVHSEEDGSQRFTQWIFYKWDGEEGRFRRLAYRVVKPAEKATLTRHAGRWRHVWAAKHSGAGVWPVYYQSQCVIHALTSPNIVETWTTYDREVEQRPFDGGDCNLIGAP